MKATNKLITIAMSIVMMMTTATTTAAATTVDVAETITNACKTVSTTAITVETKVTTTAETASTATKTKATTTVDIAETTTNSGKTVSTTSTSVATTVESTSTTTSTTALSTTATTTAAEEEILSKEEYLEVVKIKQYVEADGAFHQHAHYWVTPEGKVILKRGRTEWQEEFSEENLPETITYEKYVEYCQINGNPSNVEFYKYFIYQDFIEE